MSSFTPGLASTNAPVPMATGGAKTPSSSGGGGGGAVAGGVIAALVILGALVLVAVLCYLYIRKTKGIFIFKGKSSSKDVISSACPCFALASKGRSDDAYEPVQMGQSENTEPQVDITTSIKTHYEPMDMNMCSVTSSLQTHPYEPTDMNTSSIAIPSNQSHPYEPTDMNTSSIVTSSLHNPYEPVDVNASIVSVSVNPYEPVEVGKLLDNDTSTRMNAPPEPRYSKTPDVSGGVRDKVNEGFTNKLALVTPERKGTDARPDEDQATRAALYGSYDVPRPLDPYDIPRGSSVSHPPPPGELYDTPRTSQYDKPRTSVSVHPPKEVDPSDAKVDVSHTYDIPS
ncbi:hypothetical protein EMCRGX_G015569 [Ephydatia muelleri]